MAGDSNHHIPCSVHGLSSVHQQNYRPPLSPPKAGRTSLSASWMSSWKVCVIVFLYNYAVHILYGKTGDGYGFYCMLKQPEIDVQSTSNRKLPNFYEKVTDFLLESYRISKWWQNSVLTEAWRDCYNQRVLTYYTNWIFIQTMRLFMHSCRLLMLFNP